MEIQKRIIRQRVQHIVNSYQLDGNDGDAFTDCLTQLLENYPQSLVELALTKSIVKGWSDVPMQKGMSFIYGMHERLRSWQSESALSNQASAVFNKPDTSFVGTTSLDIIAARLSLIDSESIDPESIDTILTPPQFEQITGLDASLVFDETGKVLVA